MRLMSRSTERSIQPLYLLMIGKAGLSLINSDYWFMFMLKKWWKPPENEINRKSTYFCPTSKKSNVVNSCVFCSLRCWDEKSNARQIWEFCSSRYVELSFSLDEKKSLTWLHIPQHIYFVGYRIPGWGSYRRYCRNQGCQNLRTAHVIINICTWKEFGYLPNWLLKEFDLLDQL